MWALTLAVVLYLYVLCSLLLFHASDTRVVRQEHGLKAFLSPLPVCFCAYKRESRVSIKPEHKHLSS